MGYCQSFTAQFKNGLVQLEDDTLVAVYLQADASSLILIQIKCYSHLESHINVVGLASCTSQHAS